MTNEIQVFKYHDKPVRTVEKDGETWFIARDVCDALEIVNITRALNPLDNDEKSSFHIMKETSKLGGNPNFSIISFAGLYKLIFNSRKPEAKKFTRWVTHEVLPSIHKKGYYAVPVIQTRVDALEKENALLRGKVSEMIEQIDSMRSFTMLGQAFTLMQGLLTTTEVAKVFAQRGKKIGQNRLFAWARENGLMCKRKGRQWNQPTQKAIEQGFLNISVGLGYKGVSLWTPKGIQLFADFLAKQEYPLLVLIDAN